MTHGEIWWVDFGIPIGSLPGYKRPVIIMQKESKLNTVFGIPRLNGGSSTKPTTADIHIIRNIFPSVYTNYMQTFM